MHRRAQIIRRRDDSRERIELHCRTLITRRRTWHQSRFHRIHRRRSRVILILNGLTSRLTVKSSRREQAPTRVSSHRGDKPDQALKLWKFDSAIGWLGKLLILWGLESGSPHWTIFASACGWACRPATGVETRQ